MVSIKRCSILLNSKIPKARITSVKTPLYPSIVHEKELLLNKAYLNVSTMDVMGFSKTKILYLSGMLLNGYIIGVAYISSWTPKLTKNCRSLYLVVSEEIIIPKPSPISAIINKRTGISSRYKFMLIEAPIK